MQSVWLFAVLAFAVSGLTSATSAEAQMETGKNPMRRIITMLQDMQKELEREGEAEKEIFEKAMCVCETGEGELQTAIEEATAAIQETSSKIEADTAEKTQLTQEIADHKTAKEQATKDLAEATALRKKDAKAFAHREKDFKVNIQGLSQAIPAIEKGMGGAALMQMPHINHLRRMFGVTPYLSSEERSQILAFLDQGSDDADGESAQASGSGEILGMMKQMKEEMEKDLAQLQADEKSAAESFGEMKASKEQEIDVNEKAVISKDKRIGALALSLSEGKHALEDAQEELANAQKFKANMKEDCANKAKERDMRAKMRTEEIAAIGDAIKILNDDDALETFSKAKGSFVQEPTRTYDAFMQLAAKVHVKKGAGKMFLHAANGETQRGPSDSKDEAVKLVSGMINGMVSVLHDQDVGDEHKKEWCVNETAVVGKLEAEKKDTVTKTGTAIEEQTDQIATLAEEIKGLTAKINELDKLVHETTEQRKKEHQAFVDEFATSATAIRLVTKAIKRLEKFYSPEKYAKEKKAAEEAALKKAGLAFMQKKHNEAQSIRHAESSLLPGGFDDSFIQVRSRMRVAPVEMAETPGGTYKKSESGGVIGLMNEFVTELKVEMTEGETEEKFNSKEYTRFMGDAQETRATDTKSLNEKKATKATLDAKLVENKELLEATEEEVHNLELYSVELHTECDFLVRNFEVRHEGRVDEEVGLKSAETIVTDEEPPAYRDVEGQFEEEKTDGDVEQNFEGQPGALNR